MLRRLLLAAAPLAAARPLRFSNATDGRSLATLSSDTLSWRGCRDADDDAALSGAAVSSSSFACPSALDALELRAVPGTALVNLILNGSFPGISDPFVDDNLARFPDINATKNGRAIYTFWWRTEFSLPDNAESQAERFWLRLRGINYRANIFLNGAELTAHPATVEVAAMYQRFVFDLTSHLKPGGRNVLAILVKPPDVVGTADQPGYLPGGGQGGDHGMASNGAVMQYTEGWDWAVGTADRNTGIWDLIQIERLRSAVAIRHPYVATDAVIVAGGGPAEGAKLAVSATLTNTGEGSVSGVLSFHFLDSSVQGGAGRVDVTIPGGGSVEAQLPSVAVTNASLWWPQPLGQPVLHRVRLEFTPSVDRLTATAVRELTVGLRTTEAVVEQHSGGRSFLINGAPIFLAGGNWIGTDQLLRYSTDRERYYNEVRMHKEMGMNLIRVWGGGLTERPEFYEAADELGMLVMQEFWMTGDNNGRWAGDNDWPNDHSLYLSCAADMMRMIRNHPSLLFWCGGNELLPKIGQAGWQMDLIDHKLRNLVSELDRTRFYIPSSMGTYTCKKEKGCKWGPYAPDVKHNNTFSLAPSDGPYNVLDEQQYYMPGAGGTVDAGGDDTGGGIVFQPETGNLATPTHASLQRFLSPEVVADFPTRGADPEGHGSNAIWNYHKYITTTEKEVGRKPGVPGKYDHIYSYGAPADTAAYCKRSQLMQFAQYKALFEGYMEHMFASPVRTLKGMQYGYTAVIFWKSQSPWPALRGALYDSYLATTGGFWGARAALQPLHVQLNLHTMTLTAINMRAETSPSLRVRVSAYAVPSGEELSLPERLASIAVAPLEAVSRRQLLLHHVPWPETASLDSVVLYRLELFDAADPEAAVPLDSNTYWLSHPGAHQDYSTLAASEQTAGGEHAATVALTATPVQSTPLPFGRELEVEYELTLTNHGPTLAFGIWLEVTNITTTADVKNESEGGVPGEARLLPAWFSQNIIALLPGEHATVRLRLSQAAMQVGNHGVELSGWNAKSVSAMLPPPN